jgi:hypothetical protein
MPTPTELWIRDEDTGGLRIATEEDFRGDLSPSIPSAPFIFVANGVAAICLPANSTRTLATFTNVGAVNVWFGIDDTVTPANGVRYYPDTGFDDWLTVDAWWVITEGGDCEISIQEFTRAQS